MTRLIQQGHRRRRASVFVALASVGALAVAACSSGSSGSSSGSGTGSTGGSIHMTVLGSDTGAYAEIGQAMYNGAVAGAAQVNAAGGIMGQKLVLDKVEHAR